MKKLSFFSVLLMAASVFLFLGGCQKDEEKFLEAHQKNSIEKNLMPLDSFPKAKRYIERQLRNVSDRNAYFNTTDIDYSQTLVTVTGYNERTYSLALDHDPSEGWIYNIVMHEKDGIIDNVKIVGIRRLTNKRMLSYQYALEEGFGTGSRSLSLKECIRSQYVLGNGPGNSGGGGSEGDNPTGNSGGDGIGNGVIYGNNGNSDGGNGDPGPGDPGPGGGGPGGGGPGGGSGGGSGGNPGGDCDTTTTPPIESRVLIWHSSDEMDIYEPFNPIYGTGTNTDNLGTTGVDGSRDLSADCKNLLKKYGILNKNGKLDEDKLDKMLQDCRESVPDLKSMIDDMAQNNLTNPCDNTQYELDAEGIELELCLSGDYSRGGLQRLMKEASEGLDYVDDVELAENCPCVNAIWKQIKAYTQNNNLGTSECSVLQILDDFIEGPLQVEFGVTANPTGKIRATTLPNTTYGPNQLLFNTRIEINKDLCGNSINIDPLEMAGTLLHEIVHARIYEHLYNLGYNTSGINLYDVYWEKFVESNYQGIAIGETQHQLMAQIYVNDIAQALHDLNGGIGEPSDYLFIAWQGLDLAFNEKQKNEYGFFPDFDQLKTNYISNVMGQGSINFNGCN